MRTDTILPFIYEKEPIKGALVILENSWQRVLKYHKYPKKIDKIIAELLSCSVLLANSLKFEGSFSIQIQGSGPIQMLVAECNEKMQVRATATLMKNFDFSNEDLSLLTLVDKGFLSITLCPKKTGDSYQSIIPITSNSIGTIFESYLEQSEQITSKFKMFSEGDMIGGILLQKIPSEEDTSSFQKIWDHIVGITDSLTIKDVLDSTNLLKSLAGDEDIRLFNAKEIKFACNCSREKVADILLTLGKEEALDIVKKEGSLKVTCEFCGNIHEFDSIDVSALFSNSKPYKSVH